jgi:hypothetical protein
VLKPRSVLRGSLDDVRRRKVTGMSRIAVLNLQRGMAYAETLPQFLAGVMHKGVIGASLGTDEMRRQRRLGRA